MKVWPRRDSEIVIPGLYDTVRPFMTRFFWASVYFNSIIAVGTFGYVVVEEWDFLDALYMAVITATSVGFMEVRPLSEAGRIFTMVLLIGGITGLGIWWALITAFVVETDLAGILRRRRSMKAIDTLKNHFIVCGAGRMGRVIIREMCDAGVDFVVVECSPEKIHLLHEEFPQVIVMEGDATKEHTLKVVGIDHSRGIVAGLATDADNLLLCMTARGLNRDIEIVARATDEESLAKLKRAGANHAISPNVTGAVRMAATMLRPAVTSFLDAATVGADISLRLEEAEIPPGSSLAGKSLADARIPSRTGLIVLALRAKAGSGVPTYNPGPEVMLAEGDVMIVLGHEEQIENLRQYVGG